MVFNEDGQIKGHKRWSEENRSGEDWYKQSWHRGFWTRRHDEGNHKTVYKVLSDIFYHYDKVKKDTLLNNSIIIGKDTCLKSDFVQTYELGACVVTGHYTHNHLTDEAFTGKLFEDEDSTYCINEYKDGEETGITCYYKGGELLRNGNQWFYKNGIRVVN